MGEQEQVSKRWMIAAVAAVAVAFVAVLAAILGVGTTSQAGTSAAPTTATTPAPTPEESFIGYLDASGHFPGNVADNAPDVWIRTGQAACNLLKVNGGDVVGARSGVAESLVDYSGEGWSEPGLAERAVVVVEAASRYLCPEAPTS